jgi:hypothetical protein
MTRTLVAAAIVLFSQAGLAATTRVDIGDTRALDAIRESNPGQYEKVMGILRTAQKGPSCETLPRLLKVQYGAHDVRCAGELIRTSYPAKRWLSFKLEETEFSGNVVLTGSPGKLRPAVDNATKR